MKILSEGWLCFVVLVKAQQTIQLARQQIKEVSKGGAPSFIGAVSRQKLTADRELLHLSI